MNFTVYDYRLFHLRCQDGDILCYTITMKQKFYAYSIPAKHLQGVVDTWPACEKIVAGVVGAKYKSFRTREEANAWLDAGADYSKKRINLEPGIYFDAGTGRGNGVEISVTDEMGEDLLYMAMAKSKLNQYGKHLIVRDVTNNYGELLACKYALTIAMKCGIKKVFGDSRLIVEFWSKGFIKKGVVEKRTVTLAQQVAKLRKEFEGSGGELGQVYGERNPADLGFH